MEDKLPVAILLSVLGKTDANDCARAGSVNRRWGQLYNDEELWRSFCLRDFSVSSKADPQGNPCKSYKETYNSWRTIFDAYPKLLVSRAKQCWSEIKDWLRINFVEVLNSLVPGVSLNDIKAAEEELGFQLPDSVRLLYQLCNGQVLPDDEFYDRNVCHYSNHVGLLGGYHFYQHFVNVHLLPLGQVVKLTRAIVPEFGLPSASKRVVIAASCNSVKVFFLDCDDGQVYVGTRNLQNNGEMIPCTPSQGGGIDLKDGLLRWLERYNHCLQTGMYNVRVEKGIRSISLFPSKGPCCIEAITKRIEIQISAIFVPELSTAQEDLEDPYLFSYSVSMRLLPQSRENSDPYLESAQLLARHWIIQPSSVEEVRGEAVIGRYPLLKAGGERFVYQSCCSLTRKSGTIEGDFTFVPGRLSRPTGAEFPAYVARCGLELPEYIF